MTDLLSKAILNWLYAVETKDSFLFADTGNILCSLLSQEGLNLLFSQLCTSLSAKEKTWIRNNLIAQ